MLYFYGMRLGLEAAMRGYFRREVIKSILIPENYWRSLENRLTFQELQPSSSDRILDVGSPKLLSLFLAERVKAEIHSTDIEEYFISDYELFRSLRRIPPERFRPTAADGRNLPFPDGHFSKVYSISVLEHIPGDGDTQCIREVARTMRRGGHCVVTVPFSPESRVEYKKPEEFYWSGNSVQADRPGVSFYQRRYSEDDLQTRLIIPSGLHPRRILFFGERCGLGNGREISQFLPTMAGPLHPLCSAVFHARPSASWRNLKKPLGALVVMEKC